MMVKSGKRVQLFNWKTNKKKLDLCLKFADHNFQFDEYNASTTAVKNAIIHHPTDVAIIGFSSLSDNISCQEVMSEIAFEIRQIAEELQVPIICCCQINKKENVNPFEWSCFLPTIIEQEASTIIKVENVAETDCAKIIVAKNKYGSTGTIPATFDKEKWLFIEKEL